MVFVKNILGRVFALWAAIVFTSTLFVVVFCLLFIGVWKEPRRSYIMHGIYKVWMLIFLPLSGVRLRVRGKDNFQKGANYVVVFNHNSLMDVPISVPFTRGANKTIAKTEMAKVPLFGLVYKRGSVLVDRNQPDSRKKSYMQMKEVLNMGLHMCIYPEGTRNKTAEPLQPFHDGAFRLSFETGKAILPALIFNSAAALPMKVFYYWPARIKLQYLEAVEPRNFTSASDLKAHVYEIMRAYYVAHR